MQLAKGLWVSPWRKRVIKGVPHHICDVAPSRKDRNKQHVEVKIPVHELSAVPNDKRQAFLAEQIVQAAKILGIVKGEQQPAAI